jgi:hypothetical protein
MFPLPIVTVPLPLSTSVTLAPVPVPPPGTFARSAPIAPSVNAAAQTEYFQAAGMLVNLTSFLNQGLGVIKSSALQT